MSFEDYIIDYYCRKSKEHQIKTKKEAQAIIELLGNIFISYNHPCQRHLTLSENYLGFHLNITDKDEKGIVLKDRYYLSEEASPEVLNYFYRNICITGITKEYPIQIGKMTHQETEAYGLIKKQNIKENNIEKQIYFGFTSFNFERFNHLLTSLCEYAYQVNDDIYQKMNQVLSPKNIEKIKKSRIRVEYK